MSTWILYVCIGVSSWGCGAGRTIEYPTKAECYESLAAMRTGDQPIAESGVKRNSIAFCAPKGAMKP